MAKLLKTRVRGGVLTLTERELILGDGWLGAQHVRRFPLHDLIRAELLPMPEAPALRRSMLVRLVWRDGQTTDVAGVGPAAAERLCSLVGTIAQPRARAE